MPWWTWLAIAFFLVVSLGSAVFAALLALRAFRVLRDAQSSLLGAVEVLANDADALAARADGLSDRVMHVEERFAAVQRSAAKLGVLRWALDDSLDAVTRLRRTVPRK
ncbi:MAG TPA: hypothetical protein VH306_11670 [Gaiellaceae bacterium]